ncbi:MAG: hypothetical protein EBR02_01300 [Alphaproteobacteria bacterium]|nr:hypothetical protein [Alphaproteobacteria bacterium]
MSHHRLAASARPSHLKASTPGSFQVVEELDAVAGKAEPLFGFAGLAPMLVGPLGWLGFKAPGRLMGENLAGVLHAKGFTGAAAAIPKSMKGITVGSALMNGSFAATSAFGMLHSAHGFLGQLDAFKQMCEDITGKEISSVDVVTGNNIPELLHAARGELFASVGITQLLQGASLLLSVRALRGKDAHAMAWMGLQGAQMLGVPALAPNTLLTKYTDAKAVEAAGQPLTVGMYAEVLDATPVCQGHKDGPQNDMVVELAKKFAAVKTPIAEVIKAAADGKVTKMIVQISEEFEAQKHHLHTSHFTSKVLQSRGAAAPAATHAPRSFTEMHKQATSHAERASAPVASTPALSS